MSIGCAAVGCPSPAIGWVARFPPISAQRRGFIIIRPLHTAERHGYALCVDHAHHEVDQMLMAAQPAVSDETAA